MTPPPFKTRVVGHPVTVFLAGGYVLVTLYLLYASTQLWPLIFPAAFFMNKVMQAHEQVIAFQQWKTAWDGMEGGTAHRPKRDPKRLIGVVLGLAIVGGFIAIQDSDGTEAAIGVFMVLGVAIVSLAIMAKLWGWLGRRHRRSRPAAKVTPVTVCVTKPLIPVPDLRASYRGLPEHCLRVLTPAR